VSEQLAIKTDDDWKKLEKVIRTLTPRDSDGGEKSSWAHFSLDDSLPSPEVLAEPSITPRVLHALFLFFHSELNKPPGACSRSAVKGVSIVRDSVSECEIHNDQREHLLENREGLHRSLFLEDPERVERTAREILDKHAVEPWKYSRVDMANLLRYLLDNQWVAPQMEASAMSVLAQWDAVS
jgi:hypothetical protein